MFAFRYILNTIKKQKASSVATVILVALTSFLITLGSTAANSVKEANKQTLKPFEKIGTDLTIVRHVNKVPDILVEDLPSGVYKNGLSVYYKEEKESKAVITNTFTTIGIPMAIASTFNKKEIDKIKNLPHVEKVSKLLMAYYSYYRVEQQKVILPEEEIKPKEIKISPEESERLEQKANSDSQVLQLDKELKSILSKREWELTKNDQEKIHELVWKIGNRKMEIYYQLRPDIFPAPPKREKKEIEPPPPKETLREFYIAGMEPNVGYLKNEDILTGRYFSSNDETKKVAILRKDFAEKNKLALGDKLKLIDTDYEVIGISWPNLTVNAPEVYVPLKTLQSQLNAQDTANILFIKAKSSSEVQNLKKQLSKDFPDAEINDNSGIAKIVKPSISGSTEILAKFSNIISVTLFIITCFIITLLAVYTLNKRQKEIAVLRAIGWPEYKVSVYLLADIFAKVSLGFIFGLILSLVLIPFIGQDTISTTSNANHMYSAADFFGFLAGKVSSTNVTPLHVAINMTLTSGILIKTTIFTLLLGSSVGLIIAKRIQSIKIAEVLRRP